MIAFPAAEYQRLTAVSSEVVYDPRSTASVSLAQ
jgi:hypothetical protein